MKGDKVLGQMFTPRNLVHLILDGVLKETLKDKKDMTIYDPCMGSGGFLCLTKRMMGDKVVKIVGSDIGKDPFSFAFFNVLMTTGRLPENLYFEDTLKCYRPEKADLIITNPPFALKVRYQQKNKDDNMSNGIKDMYDCFRNNNNNAPKFEEVYPFQTNSGVCLFIQHCIHKLKDGGICAIVLPDGEVMTGGRGMANFRHWFCQNANIKCIVSVPAGVFEHVGVKTAVIVFEKTGATSSIQFMQTNGLCDEIVKVCDVSVEHMGHKKYSFDPSVYLKGEEPIVYSEDVIVKTLGEVCEIQNGTRIVRKNTTPGNYDVYGGGDKTFTTNTYNREGYTILVSRFAISKTCVRLMNTRYFLNDSGFTIKFKDSTRHSNRFLGYYLMARQDEIYSLARGTGQQNMDMDAFYEMKIPIPPLEMQNEIVEDCDLLCAQIQILKTLKEQVKTEKRSYMKYDLNPLRFLRNFQTTYRQIGDVCEFKNGKGMKKDKLVVGDYPVIGGGQKPLGFHNQYNRNENTILCSSSGAYAGHISKYDKKVWASDCFSITPKQDSVLNNDYLYYILKSNQERIYKFQTGTAQPHVYSSDVSTLKIPIISQSDQETFISLFESVIEGIKKFDEDLIFIEQKIQRIYDTIKNMFYSL
jgi:type I restriction-modification system DNA methylase subunit